jgi:hypothetical protein
MTSFFNADPKDQNLNIRAFWNKSNQVTIGICDNPLANDEDEIKSISLSPEDAARLAHDLKEIAEAITEQTQKLPF